MPLLNDVQSQLNATEVARVVTPATVQKIGAVIAEASAQGIVVCPRRRVALHGRPAVCARWDLSQFIAARRDRAAQSRLGKRVGAGWGQMAGVGEMAPGCSGGTDGRTYNHPETDRCG